jgi:hypothetical protein
MSAVIRNVSVAEDINTISVPTREDGSFYTFEMIADGGWSRYYDDTPTGLLNFLIPNYAAFPEIRKLQARIRHAVDSQVRLQARLNVFFSAEGRTPEEHKLLVGPRHKQPTVSEWECLTPLVLIDAFYAPYTDTLAPTSSIADVAIPPNLWWLRPAESEMEYLRSLHETSLIDLHLACDEVP